MKTPILHFALFSFLILLPRMGFAAEIEPFVGSYAGQVVSESDGKSHKRDLNVVIEATKTGFIVTWTTNILKSDGRTKDRTYKVEFTPSKRASIYESSMKKDLFGKGMPLDPMAGEPFVWARLAGDTLSVFSLFIDETNEYEIQEYHRTLVDAGLELVFERIRNGKSERGIRTILLRQD